MGQIVGPGGQITSLEIIPEVAKRAVETVASLGIANVQIIEGDGANGFSDAAPYDRAIFTAGVSRRHWGSDLDQAQCGKGLDCASIGRS